METFGNISIFRLFKRVVFLAQKDVFLVLEYRKEHFSGLSWEKRPFLNQNHVLTPLEKSQVFDFLNFLLLWYRKSFFFFLEYRKTHFSGLYCLKNKFEKWSIFDQNHGLPPLEKSQFFDFLNLLFLQPRKTVLRSKISLSTCSWPILPKKKKVGKMAICGLNPWVNSFENI